MNEEVTQTTLRDQLEAAFDKHNEPEQKTELVKALETPAPKPEANPEPKTDDKPRDEHGKFAKTSPPEPAPVVNPEPPAVQRPTTWKKEHLPLWDKIASGQSLTEAEAKQLASYTVQRENEYKTGVSSYKTEAENAKHLQEAIAPFLPELQRHNINPTEWIRNLGNAHRTLAMGTAEQKIQMFHRLAQDYGIPLNAVSQAQEGQLDQTTLALLNKIQQLESGVTEVATWRQQQEQAAIQQEIHKFQNAEQYPHFELVRSNMARLLQSGEAPDLQTAYEISAKPIEDLIASRLSQVQTQQPDAVAIAQAAKAKAISPKSSTPKGQVAKPAAKDLRSQLEAAFDQHAQRV